VGRLPAAGEGEVPGDGAEDVERVVTAYLQDPYKGLLQFSCVVNKTRAKTFSIEINKLFSVSFF
jgi:hypothetical protein